MTGPEFTWIFHNYSVDDPKWSKGLDEFFYTDQPTKEHIQFRHLFVDNNTNISPFIQYICGPLMLCFEQNTGMKIKHIQRIKANLLMKQDGPHLQVPHCDGMDLVDGVPVAKGRYTLLYYVDDSDGETMLYDKHYEGQPLGLVKESQRVAAKKGRCVIFDSNQIHSGTCPAVTDYRMVVNCVFGV
jgi:Rps23 Pro-64 3,4-dihydroxylase Tpa1-like proline 4-hydroxylase